MTEQATIENAEAAAVAATDDGAANLATETALQAAVTQAAAEENWLAEKHTVKKEDGSIDLEASARKQADAYRALEKRIGTGDLPPKTHEEYAPEITVEGYALDELKTDPLYQDFVQKAHAAGYTNSQLALAVNEFLPRAESMLKGQAADTAADCVAKLRETWTTDSEFQTNINSAMRTINAFAETPDEAKEIVQALGNNERAIRLLARIGPELEEGRAPRGTAPAMVDVEALTKSEAYWNANHPDHTSTKARVEKYYAEKYPKK